MDLVLRLCCEIALSLDFFFLQKLITIVGPHLMSQLATSGKLDTLRTLSRNNCCSMNLKGIGLLCTPSSPPLPSVSAVVKTFRISSGAFSVSM